MIQGGIRAPWPEAVRRALANFIQGTVISDPPVLYWASPEHPLWVASERPVSDEDPAPDDGEEVVLADEDRPRYGVITTQTCDIQEEADPPKKPWVKIAPVVRAEPGWPESRLKQGRYTTFLHWVPRIPDAGLWVADLRLEVPVEKGWLVSRARSAFDGFNDSEQRRAFAARIAALYQRPALATPVVNHILKPLQARLAKSNERAGLVQPIEEFAVRFAGDELAPTAVQLVVLSHEPVAADVRNWYLAWWADHVSEQEVGAQALPPDFQLLGSMPASEYRRLIQLNWQHLSPADEG